MISENLIKHVAKGMAGRVPKPGLNKAEKYVWIEISWFEYRPDAIAVLKDIEAFNKGASVTTPPKD